MLEAALHSQEIGCAPLRQPYDPVLLVRCAVSSGVEHYLDTVGVRGSNPLPRTTSLSLVRGGRS